MSKGKQMKTPTVEEVQQYCQERNNGIDAQTFIDYYETNGWVQGRNCKPIKSWQACVRTWEKTSKPNRGNIVQRLTDRSWASDLLTDQ